MRLDQVSSAFRVPGVHETHGCDVQPEREPEEDGEQQARDKERTVREIAARDGFVQGDCVVVSHALSVAGSALVRRRDP